MDHEVAEVWYGGRWRLVDPELDEVLIEAGNIDFDPTDVPRDRFIVGGAAWEACRAGGADPEAFLVDPDLEVPQTRGWPYLLHNLLHDLAALNKTELLLWDSWGPMERKPSQAELALLDEVAELTGTGEDPSVLRGISEREPALKVPATVRSYSPALGPQEVRLTA